MKVLDIKFSQYKGRRRKKALLKCDHCGKKWWALHQNVLKTKSCGCLPSGNKTHNLSKTRQYNTWKNIIQRCSNQNHTTYKYYGGRGITFCKSWKKFENFWKDMKEGYADNLSIDRIDNDGDYNKKNCKWSNQKDQIGNRRISK